MYNMNDTFLITVPRTSKMLGSVLLGSVSPTVLHTKASTSKLSLLIPRPLASFQGMSAHIYNRCLGNRYSFSRQNSSSLPVYWDGIHTTEQFNDGARCLEHGLCYV
jgi:hypothetical protein